MGEHHNIDARMIANAVRWEVVRDPQGREWRPCWEFPGCIEWATEDSEMAFYATPGWSGAASVVSFELREADGVTAEARDVNCGTMTAESYLAAVRFYLATSKILGEA